MGYYQLTKSDVEEMIEKYGDHHIKHNKETFIDCLFIDDYDTQTTQNNYISENDYWDREPAQLYKYKYHIRFKDSLLELFLLLIKTPKVLLAIYKAKNGIDMDISDVSNIATNIPGIVMSLKKLFSELIVKLNDKNFCVYLQALTHYGERVDFSKEDILGWIPKNKTCNMHTQKWNCPFCKDDLCIIENDEGILNAFQDLVSKGVFIRHNDNYIINY